MRLECVKRLEELVALRDEWIALEDAAGVDLPFQTWEWAIAWWTHLREDRRGVRDQLRVCVVRDEDERVVAIAPMVLTERPSFGPFRVRYLQLMGADPNVTEVRAILCRPEYNNEMLTVLRAHMADVSGAWDWVAWEGLNATPSPSGVCGDTSAYVLPLPSDWQTMKRGLGRNLKESLRHCYNSLRRDGLTSSLEILEDADAIERGLGDFFRLHAGRAALKDGPKHPDVFASQQARDFLVEVCRRLAARGIARVFRLRVADRVVAVRVGFQLGQTLYLYYSGWDAAYARYSVMTTLVAEIIQDGIARGVTAVNLSTGTDVSKTRWRAQEVTYSARVEVSSSMAARVRYAGFQLVRSVGSHPAARALVPDALVRRSGPRETLARSFRAPKLSSREVVRLHGLAAAASAIVALDLMDNVLDHKIRLLPGIFEHFQF